MMNTQGAQHISSDRGASIASIIDNKIVSLEMCDMFLGDLLGYGISRYVFDFKMDKRWVVKVDCSDRNANVIENNIFVEAMQYDKRLLRWFAPCGQMSRCGRVMLQRKCTMPKQSQYPKNIPDFFVDTKYQNWGLLNGKVVCFDYAGTILSKLGNYKMIPADWWSHKARGLENTGR